MFQSVRSSLGGSVCRAMQWASCSMKVCRDMQDWPLRGWAADIQICNADVAGLGSGLQRSYGPCPKVARWPAGPTHRRPDPPQARTPERLQARMPAGPNARTTAGPNARHCAGSALQHSDESATLTSRAVRTLQIKSKALSSSSYRLTISDCSSIHHNDSGMSFDSWRSVHRPRS
jgi:hypothetical protein